MGGPSDAIRKVIGQLVILDVVLAQDARHRALATIVIPKALRNPKRPVGPGMSVHLFANTSLRNLKKGDALTIEGIIVNSGFGAYTIYGSSTGRKEPEIRPQRPGSIYPKK